MVMGVHNEFPYARRTFRSVKPTPSSDAAADRHRQEDAAEWDEEAGGCAADGDLCGFDERGKDEARSRDGNTSSHAAAPEAARGEGPSAK
jgi:hypothetical protein